MGRLVHEDAKRWREYFKEMADLLGITVFYQHPLEDTKSYNLHGELETQYSELEETDVIFEEFPKQQTLRKLGWFSEGQEPMPMIQCSWDLPNIQIGSRFVIPSGIDNAKGRVFRVTKMSNELQFPANCYCQIAPDFDEVNKNRPENQRVESSTGFTYLKDED